MMGSCSYLEIGMVGVTVGFCLHDSFGNGIMVGVYGISGA